MVSKVFGVADEEMDLSNRHECPVPGCPSTAEAHHLRDTAHRMEIAELKRKLKDTPTGRDTSRDWEHNPTASELGIASPPQLGPDDYPEDKCVCGRCPENGDRIEATSRCECPNYCGPHYWTPMACPTRPVFKGRDPHCAVTHPHSPYSKCSGELA